MKQKRLSIIICAIITLISISIVFAISFSKPYEILIIGDSLADNFIEEGIKRENSKVVVTIKKTPSEQPKELLSRIRLLSNRYDVIVIISGINGIKNWQENLIYVYSSANEAKRLANRVYLCKLVPWGGYSRWTENLQSCTDAFNFELKPINGISIIDLNWLAMDTNLLQMKSEYTIDGLHLSRGGQIELGKYIYKTIFSK